MSQTSGGVALLQTSLILRHEEGSVHAECDATIIMEVRVEGYVQPDISDSLDIKFLIWENILNFDYCP